MNSSTSSKSLIRAAYSMSVDVRVLVALAEAHQRLVRPRVAVEDRDLDDPRSSAKPCASPTSASTSFSSASHVARARSRPDRSGSGRTRWPGRSRARPSGRRSRSLRHRHALKKACRLISSATSTKMCSSPPQLYRALHRRSSSAAVRSFEPRLQPARVEVARREPVLVEQRRRAAAPWSSRPRSRARAARAARRRERASARSSPQTISLPSSES